MKTIKAQDLQKGDVIEDKGAVFSIELQMGGQPDQILVLTEDGAFLVFEENERVQICEA